MWTLIVALFTLLALSAAFGDREDISANLGESAKAKSAITAEECAVVAKENEQIRARLQELVFVNGQLKVDADMRKRREGRLIRGTAKLKRRVVTLDKAIHGNDDLQDVNDRLNKRNDGLIKTNSELSDKDRRLAAELGKHKKMLSDQEGKLEDQDHLLDAQAKAGEEKAKEAHGLHETVRYLSKEGQSLKTQLDDARSRAAAEAQRLKDAIKAQLNKIHADDMSIDELKVALAKSSAHRVDLRADAAHQKKLHADLQKRNSELQSEMAELLTKYKDTAAGKTKQDVENTKLAAKVQELKIEVDKQAAAAAADAAAAAAADAKARAEAKAAAAAKERAAKALEAADKETVEAVDADNVIRAIGRGEQPGR